MRTASCGARVRTQVRIDECACVGLRTQLKPRQIGSLAQIVEVPLHPRISEWMELVYTAEVLEAKQQEVSEQKEVVKSCDVRVNQARSEFEQRRRELRKAEGDLWDQLKVLGEKEDELARAEAVHEETKKLMEKNRLKDNEEKSKRGARSMPR